MSFLVKHSSTADGDDTMTTRREPNLREKTWPYVCERRWKVRWRGFLTRWRWPRIGNEGGLGGRFLGCVLFWRKSLKATRRRRKEKQDEYSNMSSMFAFFLICDNEEDDIWCFFFFLEDAFWCFLTTSWNIRHICGHGGCTTKLNLPAFINFYFDAHLFWPSS